jgi:hypothetical protein
MRAVLVRLRGFGLRASSAVAAPTLMNLVWGTTGVTDLTAVDNAAADGESAGLVMELPWLLELHAGWLRARWFGYLGAACIVAGGLVAAASAPAHSEVGTWAAAYLVLVGGAAQIVLGVAQAILSPGRRSAVTFGLHVVLFNAGNVAVVAGTVTGVHAVGDAGALVLLAALVLSAGAVRGVRGRAAGLYRAIVVLLALSVPVGSVLARLHPLR